MQSACIIAVAVLAVAAMPRDLCSRAYAEQFVLTDIEYTHSTTTTKDSHYYPTLPANTPKNWVAPVDYAHGSVHIVVDVKTKPPGDAPTKLQVCFEGTPSYACTAQSPTYTTARHVEWDSPFSGFWYESTVDWTQGTKKMPLILKDDMNNKPAGDVKYMPTDLHVQVTLVAKGSTFVAPPPPPLAGSGGAGAGGSGGSTSGSGGAGAGAAGTDAGEPTVDAGTSDSAPKPDAGSARPAAPGASGAGGAAGGTTTPPKPNAGAGGAGSSAQPPASNMNTSAGSGSSAGESNDDSGCRVAGSDVQHGATWSLLIAPAYLLYRRRGRRRIARLT
jgi:hypothetical protein